MRDSPRLSGDVRIEQLRTETRNRPCLVDRTVRFDVPPLIATEHTQILPDPVGK